MIHVKNGKQLWEVEKETNFTRILSKILFHYLKHKLQYNNLSENKFWHQCCMCLSKHLLPMEWDVMQWNRYRENCNSPNGIKCYWFKQKCQLYSSLLWGTPGTSNPNLIFFSWVNERPGCLWVLGIGDPGIFPNPPYSLERWYYHFSVLSLVINSSLQARAHPARWKSHASVSPC